MIEGIRRKFARSIDKDPWSIENGFKPETDVEQIGTPEFQSDRTVILAATQVPQSITNDVDSGEYYKNIVKTAIQSGGRYGGHQIPIPWLRMILAGLEWKRIDPEVMWYGFEAGSPGSENIPKIPPFEDLFPSEPGTQTRLGLN